MTKQQTNTKARCFGIVKLAALALAVVALLCSFAVMASAAAARPALDSGFTVGVPYENGAYVKEYDGTKDADIELNAAGMTALEDAVFPNLKAVERRRIVLGATATFDSENVADATKITISYTVTPKDNSTNALAAAEKAAEFLPPDMVLPARIVPKTLTWNYADSNNPFVALDSQYVWGQTEYSVTLNAADLPALSDPTIAIRDTSFTVTVRNVQASNVVGAGLLSEQTVAVALTDPNYRAEDLRVNVLVKPIQITQINWVGQSTYTYGDAAAMNVSAFGVTADGSSYPMSVVFPAGYGDAGTYTNITAVAPAGFVIADNLSATTSVTIRPRVYTVWMDSATYVGNPAHQSIPTVYSLSVGGDLPAEIRALITYTNNGKIDFGTYDVVAALPLSGNFQFVNTSGEAITSLAATLQIRSAYIPAKNTELPYQVIISTPQGFIGEIDATVTVPTDLANDAIDEFPCYKAYKVTISGTATESLTLTIPIASNLYVEGCEPLTIDDLYLYNGITGTLTPANTLEGYIVTIGDSFYQISGISTATTTGEPVELTFVIAPVYEAPFWGSVWSILLIIFLLILLIALMILLGLYLMRIRATEEEPEEEPVEEAPEVEDTTDVDNALDALADDADPAAEEEPVEGVDEAVAEAMEEALKDDEAAEAIAIVDEDDEDEDEEDEDESFGGFGSMPLDFIDAVAEADQYALWLAAESRGEMRLVTRYRRSFQSRLAQSQGNVQEYYNAIKNLLLSYKGVKGRVSWNYEAFNRGRAHVAKMNAKTKTLYLYLALNPEELADSKYGIIDMSSKKKYATVPVLMKIKGERKFKYALELIEKLCGEDMALQQREVEDVDYKLPYQTTEELVEAGLVKKMVASIPVVYSEAPVLEEAAEPVTPATEDQEVTFVEPTDDAAVAAAAEDIANEDEPKEV